MSKKPVTPPSNYLSKEEYNVAFSRGTNTGNVSLKRPGCRFAHIKIGRTYEKLPKSVS